MNNPVQNVLVLFVAKKIFHNLIKNGKMTIFEIVAHNVISKIIPLQITSDCKIGQ